MSALKAAGLTKTYGRRPVVRNISLEVSSGEIVGLFGRNGAGKTTTFHMMTGLISADGGSIHLDGEDISRLTTAERARRGLVFLPQEESVFLKTTVEKNLLMVLELLPRQKSPPREVAARCLGELGLATLARSPAHTLSGGERRRLEICRALVLEPVFFLLDEPFTGIDPLTIRDLQAIFLGLKTKGIGLVLSDHNVHDTLAIADRAIVIDGGEILVEGIPGEVAADARAVERFLGKSFRLDGEKPLSPSF
jgi:lipopolysaccharide export system ATP-binding protein